MGKLGSIQILRGLAAAVIAFAHYHTEYIHTPPLHGLAFGVDVFFVISGFVMVYTNWNGFGSAANSLRFFLRRLARIVPIYWVTTTIFLFFVLATQTLENIDSSWSHVLQSYLFYPGGKPVSGLAIPLHSVGWTLNYEMFFYLVFAIAMLLPRWYGIAAIAVLFCAGVWVTSVIPAPPPYSVWFGAMTLEFVAGVAIGAAFKSGLRIPFWLGFGMVGVGLCICFFTREMNLARAYVWGPAAALVVAGAGLPGLEPKGKIADWFMGLGDASYALYVLHPLFITLPKGIYSMMTVHLGIIVPTQNWLYLGLTMVLSVWASFVVFRRFEHPLTKWLAKRIDQSLHEPAQRIDIAKAEQATGGQRP